MSGYLIWILLSALTGNPLIAGALVLAFVFFSGRYAFAAPPPMRLWQQYQRGAALDRQLDDNPHNRAARFERAELYLLRNRYERAAEILRPNLALDDDNDTLFVMGVASYGKGDRELGEKLLTTVAERAPTFRYGAALLELGRFRMLTGDNANARTLLERYCALNSSSVEARVLLARACQGEAAIRARQEAWKVYRGLPRFQRRKERLWAYRANPARAGVVLGIIVALIGILIAASGVAHAERPSRPNPARAAFLRRA